MKKSLKTRYTAPVGAKGFEFTPRAKLDPKALGAELRKLRERANVTVGDLAERMGWASQNVSRLERGGDKREPTISSVSLYVRTLGYELVLSARAKPPLKRKTAPSAPDDTNDDDGTGED